MVMDTLGWILLEQKQLPRSLDLLSKAAAKLPDNPVIRYHHGVALLQNGQTAEARKELAAAIGAGKSFPGAEHARSLLQGL